VAEDPLGAPRAQHVTVVDRVGTQQHRVHQREDLAPGVRRTRPTAEVDGLLDQLLEPEPLAERDRQHQPGVDHRAFVVKGHGESVRRGVHHAGDLLTAGPGCPIQPQNACSGGHSSSTARRKPVTTMVD
jgi:hypothetical protein